MENLVKDLSERYGEEEIIIKNIIQLTINKGYNIKEVEHIVNNFFEKECFK